MTKIIVVSDSHGLVKELEQIYQQYKDDATLFLHCGDSELDAEHPIFKIFHAVNGNCDDRSFKNEDIVTVQNKKILVTHGHYHSVKYNLINLYYYAIERNIDIVCYGHTHYPFCEKLENVLFINPGSIFANRGIRGRTFAVIDIKDDSIQVTHIDVLTFSEFKRTN